MKAGSSGLTSAARAASQSRSALLRADELLVAHQLGMVVAEHRRGIDRDDRAHGRQPVDQRQDLVDVLLILRDEDRGAAVAHLVLDLGRRGGRIDAVDDRAERLRREIADQPLLADIAHDGDTLASRETERRQRLRGARDEKRIVAVSAFAIDAEMLGAERDVGRGAAGPLAKERRRRCAAQRLPIGRFRSGHHVSRSGFTRPSLYRLRNGIL